jgi:DNA polymerase-4
LFEEAIDMSVTDRRALLWTAAALPLATATSNAAFAQAPEGSSNIMPDDAEAFVAILPVAKFHGVGPKTAVKMRALGIKTGADLARQTLSFLQDHFGKSGSWYYDIARGRDDRSVQPDRERKSSGSETTFPEDLTDPVQIEAEVVAMANDVWAWCELAVGP